MATGGGGFNMTTDVTRIATFVKQMGVAGLNRFAEAGVHTHTLVCMWEIAENRPASTSYRKELNDCRRQQTRGFHTLLWSRGYRSTYKLRGWPIAKRPGWRECRCPDVLHLTVIAGSYWVNLLLQLFGKSTVSLEINGERQDRIWDYSNRPHAVGRQTEPISEGTALKTSKSIRPFMCD